MKITFLSAVAFAAVLSLSACKNVADPMQSAVASPTCVDLPHVTDPAQRAELQKKCPRSGAVFQPSLAKSY